MKHTRAYPLTLSLCLAATLVACGPKSAPPPTRVPTPAATDRQLRTFEALWNAVNEQYVYEDFNDVDWAAAGDKVRAQIEAGLGAQAFDEAMEAIIGELPEGLVIRETREERLAIQQSDASTYEGIGAFVSVRSEPTPRIVLLGVMKDSPAAQAGLAAHDSIYAIDGEPVLAEEGVQVIERVRGPAGTTVTLTVQSPGDNQRDLQVSRGALTVAAELLAGIVSRTQVAYFLVPTQAPEGMAEGLVGALQTMAQSQTLEGIILDLRIARSGGPWPLAELLTVFGDGPLGKTHGRYGDEPLEITGQNFFESQRLPLVILVGPDTEGAPEALAGALQGSGRAQIVGLPTPGHVEGLSETALPDGSRVFIASSTFVTPQGRDLGLEGVEPDALVDADWDQVSNVFDPVLDKAVELIREQ